MPASNIFPSLKILEVVNPLSNLMQQLFCSCPVLEDLSIDGELLIEDMELIFDVSASELKRLRIRLTGDKIFPEQQYKFLFNAPKLEYLDLYEEFLAEYTVENLSSLVNASIYIGGYCYTDIPSEACANHTLELLKGISCVVSLSLCEHLMSVTIFHCCGWKLLPNLLESSPNLKELVLKKKKCQHDEVAEDFDWSELQSVLDCLSFHIVVIKIEGLEGKRDELKLVEYLLGNAKVLNELCINSPRLPLEDEVKFCNNLLKFRRGSSNCQIQFLGDFFSKF